ncbi:MAG: N-6 DNA methylase [Chloroflexota bacterium]|nr:N-6 DNA methylase [Chloroflexota bacterium]
MPLSPERLREIVSELASRPRHEKVRTLVYELLVGGLGASSTEVDFERPVPEVHGRIDALMGRTVFEFKSDLRREKGDAEARLPDYLAQREKETGQHFVGIATDGAEFLPYELRAGRLRSLPSLTTSVDNPREFLAWLSSTVAVSADLEPTPEAVRRELGRGSLAWHMAREELAGLWSEVGAQPNVRVKRGLWAQLMERVYGAWVDQDDLFFQHTYLTTIAKTMATYVLGVDVPEPSDLLAGRPFQEAGIGGAVESDFFDWLLASSLGNALVRRIALQAGRFRLRDVQTDVLKGLYESLVDPEQRHDLGEYYTPDWLSQRMCARAIERPLEQRVLDPACGSGTFLFHAVRRLLSAADEAKLSIREGTEAACRQVLGVDVHPVSVQIARVTFLLALGEERLLHRPPHLTIPVYLGDSLQWNTRGFLAEREVLIEVPGGGPLLEFPFDVAGDPAMFDAVIERMLQLSRQDAPPEGLSAWLERTYGLGRATTETLARTYETLRMLHRDGRDHIWGFVARNLVRPVWLSQEDQRADVVIGNPPWLSYRYMEPGTQRRFREECQRRGLWAGGKVATHQDLSGYFFVRCVELYLKLAGAIAFVMPYAALSRRQSDGFRSGVYGARRGKRVERVSATVQFTEAWAFSDDVQPLFPVPSCVLFGRPGEGKGKVLPDTVLAASGTLPRRDASAAEADAALSWREAPRPPFAVEEAPPSPYHDVFRQGATIVPRVLCVVQPAPVGAVGPNPAAPLVESRRTSQEKPPWKHLPPVRDNVEGEFLRPLYLGESVAPFRLLEPVLAVIPWDDEGKRLLDSEAAQRAGYMHLSGWLQQAERLWAQHSRGGITFTQRLDYNGELTAQFPTPQLRVVYAASGTLPAAAILRDCSALVEHALYWIAIEIEDEARYLTAVLNSETARARVADMQARGQWGARHFDKVMLSLPIPRFDASNALHEELAKAAGQAEQVAGAVKLRGATHFVRARQLIRAALLEDGVAQRIDRLVVELLGQQAVP